MTLQNLKEARSIEILFYSIAAFILIILIRVSGNLVSVLLSFLSLVLLILVIIKRSKEKKQKRGMKDEEIKSEEPKVETDPTEMGGKSEK